MKPKILIAGAAVLFTVLLSSQLLFANDAFKDVSSSNDNYDAIQYVYEEGIVQGYSDNTYKPNQKITRAEFTKIIIEANFTNSEINNCDKAANKFSDTPLGDWYTKYVCVARTNDIIEGYTDGTFRPADDISFAEAAKIIAIGYGEDEEDDDPWYKVYVDYLAENNAIPTTISGFNDEISRGEMAEMIYRLSAGISDKESLDYDDIASGNIATDASEIDYGYGAGLLPLGDDKFSSQPKAGYVYSCMTNFNGGGAFNTGEWINTDDGYWNPYGKVTVDGDVEWPQASISIVLNGDSRDFVTNGLPTDHNTGIYPIQKSDDAYDYDRNPHSIEEQDVVLSLPADPEFASSASCLDMGMIGVSLNGVAIFNAFDAAGRDAPAYEIQDQCDGHPESNGEYHYHNLSNCFEDNEKDGEHSELWAYALDGFGLYGPKGENGEILTNDDLDECHGHTHEIEWDGETVEMYHYHATYEYPYTLGCYRGTPVDSPSVIPGQGPQGGPGGALGMAPHRH